MAYLRNLISLKCLDLRRFQMISLGRQGITWPHLMTLVMVVKMGFTYINQAKSFFHVRSTIQSLGGACIIDNMATASMCWVCVTMFFKNSMYSSSMLLLMLLVLWIEFMRQRQFTIYYFGSSCPLHHCLLVVFFFFFQWGVTSKEIDANERGKWNLMDNMFKTDELCKTARWGMFIAILLTGWVRPMMRAWKLLHWSREDDMISSHFT